MDLVVFQRNVVLQIRGIAAVVEYWCVEIRGTVGGLAMWTTRSMAFHYNRPASVDKNTWLQSYTLNVFQREVHLILQSYMLIGRFTLKMV